MLHVVVAAGAMGVSACSLLVATSGLSGGADASDAAADALASDSRSSADGSASGSDGSSGSSSSGGVWDAAAGPFCSTRSPTPTFCNDFDTSSNVQNMGAQSQNGPAAVSEIDHATYTSASSSLHLGIPAGVPGTTDGFTNRILYNVAAPTTSTHFECDLRIDATSPSGQPYFVWYQLSSPRSFLLYVNQNETGIEVTPGYTTHALSQAIPLGVWKHVDMDVAWSSPPKLTVKIDGVVALDAYELPATFTPPGAGLISVGPAEYTSQSMSATEAHFDNVLFVLK